MAIGLAAPIVSRASPILFHSATRF